MEEQEISILLREELLRRQAFNPRYSLRAFAQALDMSSSFLSKVMNAQRGLSSENVLKISNRLNLNDQQVQSLMGQSSSARKPSMNFEPLKVDEFKLISEWYHYAILEAVTLPQFKAEAKWIANFLDISEEASASALERLIRLGLIKKDLRGRVDKSVKNHSTVSSTVGISVPSSAQREHERQILEQALAALQNIPIEERSQSSMTLAIPSSRVPEAKDLIKKFRREMTALLQRRGERDSVYQMSISFFPISKKQDQIQTKIQKRAKAHDKG